MRHLWQVRSGHVQVLSLLSRSQTMPHSGDALETVSLSWIWPLGEPQGWEALWSWWRAVLRGERGCSAFNNIDLSQFQLRRGSRLQPTWQD